VTKQRALIARAGDIDASILAKSSLLGGTGAEGEPRWATRAAGCYIWDEEDRRYLDLLLGFGSVILGHADPVVTEAVIEDVREAVSPSLRKVKELELTELLTTVVPNAEMAMLLKTGSDATSAAVRVARAYTGRRVVLRGGYQGWHDWCAPRVNGIPPDYHQLTETLPFNDPDALRATFARHRDQVAALIIMPTDGEGLDRDYLIEARRLADRYGSLFVLDEVRTGFRLALGGAQEYFGVDADLVAVSKAMANGHAISALLGRREVMRTIAEVSMSSVFFRSTDSMAAALATIRILMSTDALEVVWQRGRNLQEGMAAAAVAAGVPVRVTGLAPMPFHRFELRGVELERAENAFYEEIWREGLLLHRTHHWFTCAAMSEDDIRRAVEVINLGYQAAARCL
jgi:glutamate-1-semialdehyde 2,1-aminomutase